MSADLWPRFSGSAEEITNAVFAWALARFRWTPDVATRGQLDHWPSPADLEQDLRALGYVQDDCDGFAAMCRHALRVNGVQSRLVLCWVENAEYHAVCEVAGLILDNRQLTVCPSQDLERVGYVWDRMSGVNDGDDWTSVGVANAS